MFPSMLDVKPYRYTPQLRACIRNSEFRVQELIHDLENFIAAESLASKQAQRLRGRMQLSLDEPAKGA